MLFLFWRVPKFSCNSGMAAPHTSQPCFSFWVCASLLLDWRMSCSAHATTLLFFFGVCQSSLGLANELLRTRHNLAFLFWRVTPPSWAGKWVAPHTSKTCFSFLACTVTLSQRQMSCSAHANPLIFWKHSLSAYQPPSYSLGCQAIQRCI